MTYNNSKFKGWLARVYSKSQANHADIRTKWLRLKAWTYQLYS
jgi:hypothetical protein